MPYSLYIIYSAKLDRYNVGYSESVQERLLQHNAGISEYTAKANDWILKYSQQFESRKEAMNRENEIKKKKSGKYIEWIINDPKELI